MTEHDLKLNNQFFAAVRDGSKNFEVRIDDRGFQAGDTLVLRRFGVPPGYLDVAGDLVSSPEDAETIRRKVTYVMSGENWGIVAGYVVMGLAAPDDQSHISAGTLPSGRPCRS